MATNVLTPDWAAQLYAAGLSACQIREQYPRMTRVGVERKIRQGGLEGVQWCPLCRDLEELHAPRGLWHPGIGPI